MVESKGCAAALNLAKRGKSVTLLERDQAGTRAASAVNFGGVRRHGRNIAGNSARSAPGGSGRPPVPDRYRRGVHSDRACSHRPQRDDIDTLRSHLAAVAPLGLQLEFLDRADLGRRFPWLGSAAMPQPTAPMTARRIHASSPQPSLRAARDAGASLDRTGRSDGGLV